MATYSTVSVYTYVGLALCDYVVFLSSYDLVLYHMSTYRDTDRVICTGLVQLYTYTCTRTFVQRLCPATRTRTVHEQ